MSLRGEVWAHITGLTPAPFIEIPVHEGEWSCICVFGVSILPLSTILILFFWNLSDILVCFVCHFIRKIGGKEKFELPLEI